MVMMTMMIMMMMMMMIMIVSVEVFFQSPVFTTCGISNIHSGDLCCFSVMSSENLMILTASC